MVERICLEWCPSGNLLSWLLKSKTQFLEEEDIWWLFRCLALGSSVLSRGTEDLNKEAWGHEIVHMDLHAGNGNLLL